MSNRQTAADQRTEQAPPHTRTELAVAETADAAVDCAKPDATIDHPVVAAVHTDAPTARADSPTGMDAAVVVD